VAAGRSVTVIVASPVLVTSLPSKTLNSDEYVVVSTEMTEAAMILTHPFGVQIVFCGQHPP